MSRDPRRIDLISAEHLMRGARSGSPTEPNPLAVLLAAAVAPAREEELAGEDNAVAAFRDARLAIAPAPEPRKRFMLKSVVVKASVVAAVAVVGGGGVAVAATTGHLPGTNAPDTHAATRASHAAPAATASGHASRPAATRTPGAAASHAADPGTAPNLRGLCTAFQAHAGDNPGKALQNPAFKTLIDRAGGKNDVAAYCATLLATPAGNASSHRSDASTHASTHAPSDPPSSHPTNPRPTRSTPSHPAPSTTNTHIP
jgi:hypothetical protein